MSESYYLCAMMKDIIHLESVSDYCNYFGAEFQHPLVTVANFADYGLYAPGKMQSNLYCIMFKDIHCGEMLYGRSKYDYQAGTLLFMSPGQIIGLKGRTESDAPKSKGFILLFHLDIMYGTPLARRMKEYSFFSYDSNEALHMSEREKATILNCFREIKEELDLPVDKHTKQIVSSRIETLLNHCVRFYERQFVTREISNHHLIGKLDTFLQEYYINDRQSSEGIPSVQQCAGKLCLSPNYFSDLIKRETGKTALEYIQGFIVDQAKIMLTDTDKNITEIAYDLGFKYPHHLTRVFKKITGITPLEFRTTSN